MLVILPCKFKNKFVHVFGQVSSLEFESSQINNHLSFSFTVNKMVDYPFGLIYYHIWRYRLFG